MKVLSNRERQVLALAANGLIDKEIGVELGVTMNTLRTYWSRIRSKVGDLPRSAIVSAFATDPQADRPLAARLPKGCDWELDVSSGMLIATDEINATYGLKAGIPHHRSAYIDKYHPDDQRLVRAGWDKILAGEIDTVHLMYRVVTKGGHEWVSVFAELVRGANGKPEKIVGHRVSSWRIEQDCLSSLRIGFLTFEPGDADAWADDEASQLLAEATSSPSFDKARFVAWLEGQAASGVKRVTGLVPPHGTTPGEGTLHVELLVEPGTTGLPRVMGAVAAFE